MKTDLERQIEDIITVALKAPSGDNCQPWKFQIEGQKLFVFHDEARATHQLNRKNHASFMALGSLLEAMQIAASVHHLKTETKLIFEQHGSLSLWAEVSFLLSNQIIDPLVETISIRCTDRRLYKKGDLDAQLIQQLMDLNKRYPGCALHLKKDSSHQFINYLLGSEKFLWTNKRIVKDLFQWIRFSENEVKSKSDGMSLLNIGVNIAEAFLLRFIRKFPQLPRMLWPLGFKQKITTDLRKSIESSAGLICFSVNEVSPVSLCHTGRMAYRVWLLLNSHSFGVQPLSFSSTSLGDLVSGAFHSDASEEEIQHFSEGLKIVRDNFDLKSDEIPVWIFRTGLSKPLPNDHRTPRLPLHEILINNSKFPDINK